MWKVIKEVETIRAGTALVRITLLEGLLQVSDSVRPEFSFGIGTAPFVIIPPAPTPDLTGGHSVLFAILDIDFPLVDSTPHQPQEHPQGKQGTQRAREVTR